MRKSILATCILFIAFAIPTNSRAQDKPAEAAQPAAPIHYYRLTLIVQDVDANNKPINSRSYVTTITTDPRNHAGNSIRTGSRVPVSRPNGYDFVDTGINFDVREVHEFNRDLSLNVKADISSYTPTESPTTSFPIVHHNQWEAPVLIPIGKPTVIFSSDALESKNAMQVVAIVTPIS